MEIHYNYTDKINPEDKRPRDLFYCSGSDSVMVDRNHTNPNPLFRFSEKCFRAVVELSEKL
mgnify:FL=1